MSEQYDQTMYAPEQPSAPAENPMEAPTGFHGAPPPASARVVTGATQMEIEPNPLHAMSPMTPTTLEYGGYARMKAEPGVETGVPPTGDAGAASASYQADVPPVAVKQESSADVLMHQYDPSNPSGPPPPPEVKRIFTNEWWKAAQLMTRDGAHVMFRGNGAILHDLEDWLDMTGQSHTETGGYVVPWSII